MVAWSTHLCREMRIRERTGYYWLG